MHTSVAIIKTTENMISFIIILNCRILGDLNPDVDLGWTVMF